MRIPDSGDRICILVGDRGMNIEHYDEKIARALAGALRSFVAAHDKKADHIADSDLDNEQPRSVDVTLGDIRVARRLLQIFDRSEK